MTVKIMPPKDALIQFGKQFNALNAAAVKSAMQAHKSKRGGLSEKMKSDESEPEG